MWNDTRVGAFHQRISDARWIVGTWEPFEHELTDTFLQAVASMPERAPHELDTTGIPISYTKLEGGKRTMHGLVEHIGAPLVFKEEPEMIIGRFTEAEIERYFRWTGSYYLSKG